jgi:hypothetical protein
MSGCRQASAAEAVLLFSSKLQPEDGQEFLSAKAVLQLWIRIQVFFFIWIRFQAVSNPGGFNITPDLVVASKMSKN